MAHDCQCSPAALGRCSRVSGDQSCMPRVPVSICRTPCWIIALQAGEPQSPSLADGALGISHLDHLLTCVPRESLAGYS